MLVVSGGKATEPPGVSVIALVKLVRSVAAGLSQQSRRSRSVGAAGDGGSRYDDNHERGLCNRIS